MADNKEQRRDIEADAKAWEERLFGSAEKRKADKDKPKPGIAGYIPPPR